MPLGAAKAVLLGAAGVAGGPKLSGGIAFTYGGADFMKFTSSGTLTIEGSGLVDYIVVGSGAGGAGATNSNNGNTGGGGGGGVAWGTNYLIDDAVRTTFAITIGAGGSGGSGANGSRGGNSSINDWGAANDTANFDWLGGSSYSSTADLVGASGGGGGGRGDWTTALTGEIGTFGSVVATTSTDWASGGGGGGGGAWIPSYSRANGGAGGASFFNNANGSGIDTITNENNDATIGTHYVVGVQGTLTNGSYSPSTPYQGLRGQAGLQGTAASPVFPVSGSFGQDIVAPYQGFQWLDGARYGTPGTGGIGSWNDSADGGGQGLTAGGPVNGLANQGGGGAGGTAASAGVGATGGNGGSGIVIIRVQP